MDARLKDLLDETRLAMLGTQVLMGLQYNAAFAQRFGSLPAAYRWLDGVALVLILSAAALLISVPAYHQVAEQGRATADLVRRASGSLKGAFLPLSLALGLDVAVAFGATAGSLASALAGAVFVSSSLCLWYALPMLRAGRRAGDDAMQDKELPLETRIEHVLTELRIVLPGAQALFGFQFAAVLTATFEKLPPVLKDVHIASLGMVAATVVMLIAPAAYHRIAAGGNAEEGVLRYAVRLLLPAQGLLALGLVGDTYVTMRMVFDSPVFALTVALAALAGFAFLLYLLPLAVRRAHARAAALRKLAAMTER